MTNWFPKWAAERAYYRAAMDLIPKITGSPPDRGAFPRTYAQPHNGPVEANAVYNSANQSRVDSAWPMSRGLKGINDPRNRWRLTRLRDRARELDRNNALVTGMLDRATENVISHGMRVRPTTEDAGFNGQVEDLWTNWLDTADITGMSGPAEFQRLLHRSFLRDGDVGINLVSRGSDAWLQAVDGDRIDTMTGGYDLQERVVHGIKFNEDLRPIGFYVLGYAVDGIQFQASLIQARNFVFYARRKDLMDVRGEPCFSQVDRLFDQIDGYIEATVIAARIAACQGLIIKSKTGGKIYGNLPTQLNALNNPQKIESMEPGMIRYINPDEDVTQVNPMQPVTNFDQFIATLLRFTGLTLGLPLELVFLDFSRTTYSSARASLLQSYRSFRSQQQVFIDRVMARIYRWRVSKWVKDGTLKPSAKLLGDSARGIRPSYWDHEWVSPGWSWIDPVKEIQAAMMECDAGFNSEENVCLQHGRTLEDIIASKKKARDMSAALQVELSKSGLTRDAVITPAAPQMPVNAPKINPETGEDADESGPKQGDPETDE